MDQTFEIENLLPLVTELWYSDGFVLEGSVVNRVFVT